MASSGVAPKLIRVPMGVQAADAQNVVMDQEHLSRSLEQYARSKGVQHGEVAVTQALEGGAFNWKWSQTNEEVTLWVDVPAGTRPRAVKCDIKRDHLRLAVAGIEGTMDVRLRHTVSSCGGVSLTY